MAKKEKTQEIFENELYLRAKKELENTKESQGKKSKDEIFHQLKSCFISYINEMLKEKSFMTEQETIQRLKKFNIDRTAIEMVNSILKDFMEIEYNNKEYTFEELSRLIIDSGVAIDEINIQRAAYNQSLKDNLPSYAKEKIINQFETNLISLKDYYIKKGELQSGIVIALSEYYNYLPEEKKIYHSKDFHYYCKSLPEIINLISGLKNSKDEAEMHQMSFALTRLYAKLDDKEKENLYPKIINIFRSSEQNIDFLMIFGYSQINARKKENALLIYRELFNNFELLESSKKKYYQPIIIRYLNSIKSLQNKNENLPQKSILT